MKVGATETSRQRSHLCCKRTKRPPRENRPPTLLTIYQQNHEEDRQNRHCPVSRPEHYYHRRGRRRLFCQGVREKTDAGSGVSGYRARINHRYVHTLKRWMARDGWPGTMSPARPCSPSLLCQRRFCALQRSRAGRIKKEWEKGRGLSVWDFQQQRAADSTPPPHPASPAPALALALSDRSGPQTRLIDGREGGRSRRCPSIQALSIGCRARSPIERNGEATAAWMEWNGSRNSLGTLPSHTSGAGQIFPNPPIHSCHAHHGAVGVPHSSCN